MLDKGTMPSDGIGEDAFYVADRVEESPTLPAERYPGATHLVWAVLTVACRDPAALCQQPCASPRECAAGVLDHLPCAGVPVWSAERPLTIGP
jgi:hypothetical protein